MRTSPFIAAILLVAFLPLRAQVVVQEYAIPKFQNVDQVSFMGDSIFLTYKKFNNTLLTDEVFAGWVYQGKFTPIFFSDLQKAELIAIGRLEGDIFIYVRDPTTKKDGFRILKLEAGGKRSLSPPIKLGFKPDFIFGQEGIFFAGHEYGKDTLQLVRAYGSQILRKSVPFSSTVAAKVKSTEDLRWILNRTTQYLTVAFRNEQHQLYVWRLNPVTLSSSEFTVDIGEKGSFTVTDSCVYTIQINGKEGAINVFGIDNPQIKLTKKFDCITPSSTIYKRTYSKGIEKNIKKSDRFIPDFSLSFFGPLVHLRVVPGFRMNCLVISINLSSMIDFAPNAVDFRYFTLRESLDHTSITEMDKVPILINEKIDDYEFRTFENKVPRSIEGIMGDFLDKVYVYEKPEKLVHMRFKEN